MLTLNATELPVLIPSRPIHNLLNSGLGISNEDELYLVNMSDILFRINCFKEININNGLQPVSGILHSDTIDFSFFKKKLWKPFRESFFRKYNVSAIGTLERENEGNCVGNLHAHFILFFSSSYSEADVYERLNRDWQETWRRLYIIGAGAELRNCDMQFEKPRDKAAKRLVKYISKAYNRGVKPAKWAKDDNESYLLKANVKGKGYWTRDEMPSRTMSKRNAILWLASQLEEDPVGDLAA
jgi:hypothetical protein